MTLDAQEARRIAGRAARRLRVLQFALGGAVLVLAVFGGWLMGMLLSEWLGWPLAATWTGASVAIVLAPAVLVYRAQATAAPRRRSGGTGDDDGREHEQRGNGDGR